MLLPSLQYAKHASQSQDELSVRRLTLTIMLCSTGGGIRMETGLDRVLICYPVRCVKATLLPPS